MKISLEFVSIHGVGWSGDADMVIARGVVGELGIIAGHSPLVTVLRPGNVRIINGEDEELYYVGGGVLEVQPNGVTILADEVVPVEQLDLVEIEKRKLDAEVIMKEKQTSQTEFAQARVQLAKALAQYNTITRKRGR